MTVILYNSPALFQMTAWCQIIEKPLPEPMTAQFCDAYIYAPPECVKTATVGRGVSLFLGPTSTKGQI